MPGIVDGMLGGILMLMLEGILVTCGMDVTPPMDMLIEDIGIWKDSDSGGESSSTEPNSFSSFSRSSSLKLGAGWPSVLVSCVRRCLYGEQVSVTL